MNEFAFARDLYISYLKRNNASNFSVALLKNKLRLSDERAIELYQEVIDSVKT